MSSCLVHSGKMWQATRHRIQIFSAIRVLTLKKNKYVASHLCIHPVSKVIDVINLAD